MNQNILNLLDEIRQAILETKGKDYGVGYFHGLTQLLVMDRSSLESLEAKLKADLAALKAGTV